MWMRQTSSSITTAIAARGVPARSRAIVSVTGACLNSSGHAPARLARSSAVVGAWRRRTICRVASSASDGLATVSQLMPAAAARRTLVRTAWRRRPCRYCEGRWGSTKTPRHRRFCGNSPRNLASKYLRRCRPASESESTTATVGDRKSIMIIAPACRGRATAAESNCISRRGVPRPSSTGSALAAANHGPP